MEYVSYKNYSVARLYSLKKVYYYYAMLYFQNNRPFNSSLYILSQQN